jgi:hypothetical protein
MSPSQLVNRFPRERIELMAGCVQSYDFKNQFRFGTMYTLAGPRQQLDNEHATSVATNLRQQRNKTRRKGTTSSHLGVSRTRNTLGRDVSHTRRVKGFSDTGACQYRDKVTPRLLNAMDRDPYRRNWFWEIRGRVFNIQMR